mmetsp:Transcript_31196/g.47779  ORF Transcript_31196/g.47779 Transcript_31196/m.47779 type:complete len:82 (+) Transcript_31196:328-573(+)
MLFVIIFSRVIIPQQITKGITTDTATTTTTTTTTTLDMTKKKGEFKHCSESNPMNEPIPSKTWLLLHATICIHRHHPYYNS